MISHPFYNEFLIFSVTCLERLLKYNLAQNDVIIAVKSANKSSLALSNVLFTTIISKPCALANISK